MLEQVTYSGLRVSMQGGEGDVRKSLLTESLGTDFGFNRSSSGLTCLDFLFCFSRCIATTCFPRG